MVDISKVGKGITHPVLAIKFVKATVSPYAWSLLGVIQIKGKKPHIENSSIDSLKTPVDTFWSDHTVIGLKLGNIKTARQDRQYLVWRFTNYPLYRELMDVWGQHDNEIVLDYGCGAGNDLVGLLKYTRAKQVIGIDISEKALRFAAWRLSLHRINNRRIRLIQIADSNVRLPLEDNVVDYIYCEGVLHHISNPSQILKEFYRILKPRGRACIMVYNRDSLWFHLYVAFEQMILKDHFADISIDEAFARTTDTETCPIARNYTPQDFFRLCEVAGFSCEFAGGYFTSMELELFKKYYWIALYDRRLGEEHKAFLKSLSNERYPKYKGKYAGIGGVYKLYKGLKE